MSNTVSLYVMGLSVSQLKSGAYALILAEEKGPRRIPLVIGESEAKSIALVMEGIRTPRPVTHDLFVTFAHAFGIRMERVFIYKFEDGIFYSQITFSDSDGREVVVDSRTSDAVAIAIRTDTPIETTEDILQRTGFIISEEMVRGNNGNSDNADIDPDSPEPSDDGPEAPNSGYHATPKLENYTVEELERTLADLIDREEYEQADKVAKILEQKRKNS